MVLVLNINDDKIMSMCWYPEVYNRGLKYYKSGRIKNVDIDMEQGYAEAVVSGSEDYFVNVEFSPEGNLISTDCDCPAHHEYDGICKHIAAVLMHLMDTKKPKMEAMQKEYIKTNSNRLTGEIISFFENIMSPAVKEPVNIEVTLEVLFGGVRNKEIRPAVSLRMGCDKLYTVKSIKDLIESVDNNIPMEFGKNFTFEPYQNTFRDEDLPVIEFLREMYDTDRTIGYYSSYSYGSGSLFKGKYIYLPKMSVGRLLKAVEKKSIRANVFGKEYDDVKIISQDLPLSFNLRRDESDLVLSVDFSKDIIPLTADGRYIFQDGIIYSVSKYQSESLIPFYKAISETGGREFRFTPKDSEKFASIVMKNIKNAGEVIIDDSVGDIFLERPLEAKIYLDKAGNSIVANFSFFYGDYLIDPFNQKKNEKQDDYIIIRDYESERKILDIFERCGFKVNKEAVYLDDDDKSYEFITEYIDKLRQFCEVYYSESFRNIKVHSSGGVRSSVRYNEGTDFLEFSFSVDEIDKSELPEVFASLKEKKKYYRLQDGSFLALDSQDLDKILNVIEYLDLDKSDIKKQVINLPKYKAMYLEDNLNEFQSAYIERNIAFKRLVENIKSHKNAEYNVPESLKNIMREYQVTGFKWLKTLTSYGFGGILADDMGLGKTLQTIAFLLSEKESLNLPSIVICPTSLVYNWESEIQKFAPSLRTLVVSGSKDERGEQVKDLSEIDVLITSYPLIRRDIDNYKDVVLGYCILDEAQHIKNPGSINAKSVKELRARGYFALTGTPIENNLTELWSIFDFIMPGYLLSHRKFQEKFERPIAGDEDKKALRELKKHVGPFILRRLKKDVLKELPPKIESVLTSELTSEQKKVYLAYLEQIRGKIEDEIKSNGFEKSRIQILAGLTRLRQICCHPSLFIENYNGDSGKMELLFELLQELKEGGHRVLLFSQFTGALKLIRRQLEKEDISYFYLDGSTKIEDRGDMVKSFNKGIKDLFLISLKAGGTGLNLTGADTVIHFDPWWNPAVEEQATDRAHRIGQQSTVQVMKLITKGTIEERIYALQQRKKEVIGNLLQAGESFISKMTEEDIRQLFRI